MNELLCLFQPIKGCCLLYNEHPREVARFLSNSGDQGGCGAVLPQAGHKGGLDQSQVGAQEVLGCWAQWRVPLAWHLGDAVRGR